MRTIFHVDVNSAFLSWSALKQLQANPDGIDLRTVPSAVGGDVKTRRGVITARSIPAKAFGVKTGEPVVKALQKCPDLILVHSDFETYRACSHDLMELLRTYSPLLQQVSIDEAFLDVTDLVLSEDKEACISLADTIRTRVKETLGFTVNVGISSNKLLAKMASDFQKPDRTHTLFPEEIEEKMWPLPIESLYGCGKATADKLRSIGISTIGEAASTSAETMQGILGEKAGIYIVESANGIASDIVNPEQEKAKSISNETTLPRDIDARNYRSDGVPIIEQLAVKVAERLRKASMFAGSVTFQVKTSAFQRFSRQLSLPDPSDDPGIITASALELADRLLTAGDGLFAGGEAIRLIGVGVSKLTEAEHRQMDLFSWAEEKESEEKSKLLRKQQQEKEERLSFLLQTINARYGDGSLKKGASDT